MGFHALQWQVVGSAKKGYLSGLSAGIDTNVPLVLGAGSRNICVALCSLIRLRANFTSPFRPINYIFLPASKGGEADRVVRGKYLVNT